MKNESQIEYIKRIKTLVTVALFSDDYFLDHLVLKGGNALDLVYKVSARSSVDIDLSLGGDFPGSVKDFKEKINNSLNKIFIQENMRVFDVKVEEKPSNLSPELSIFWGGYDIKFKIIELDKFEKFSKDIENLRRNAIMIGKKSNFEIDISRFEYVSDKKEMDLDGYTVYVYSVEMLIFEKLRAICQQMPDYNPIVHRSRPGSARARDFIDIYILMDKLSVNVLYAENKNILLEIFQAKRVPIDFLSNIKDFRDFHKFSFPAVLDTMHASEKIEDFDFYFDFVIKLVSDLKSSWDI